MRRRRHERKWKKKLQRFATEMERYWNHLGLSRDQRIAASEAMAREAEGEK